MRDHRDLSWVRPSVSVIIPTYNGSRLIGETITSILDQDIRPDEIIVVNDGSSDDTASVVERFPSPVRLLTIENVGTTGARLAGIMQARGNWLGFCDHDDLWEPNHLSRLVALACDHEIPFVFSNFTHLREGKLACASHFESDPSGFWMAPGRNLGDKIFIAEDPLLMHVLDYQVIFPSCTLVHKEFLRHVGNLNPAFGRNVSEDLEFTLRCVVETPVGVDTLPTVYVSRHGGNYSADWIKSIGDSIEILKYSYKHHPLTQDYKSAIARQIHLRCIDGIDRSFLKKRFDQVDRFVQYLDGAPIPLKTAMKIAIARQPKLIARPLSTVLTGIKSLAR